VPVVRLDGVLCCAAEPFDVLARLRERVRHSPVVLSITRVLRFGGVQVELGFLQLAGRLLQSVGEIFESVSARAYVSDEYAPLQVSVIEPATLCPIRFDSERVRAVP